MVDDGGGCPSLFAEELIVLAFLPDKVAPASSETHWASRGLAGKSVS